MLTLNITSFSVSKMRPHLIPASLLAIATTALAQTPNGTYPKTSTNLGVDFGSVFVTPGAAILPDGKK
jgi:hypothetical protein